MKNTKLWSTGLAALFLSSSLLSGVASAANEENKTTENTNPATPATPVETPPTKPAPEVEKPEVTAAAKAALTTELASAKALYTKANGIREIKQSYNSGLSFLFGEIEKSERLINNKDALAKDFNKQTDELKKDSKKVQDNVDRYNAKEELQDAIKAAKAVDTTKKPTKEVAKLKDLITKAEALVKDPKSTTEALTKAKTDLKAQADTVVAKAQVYKMATGTDGEITVNFKTADGKTVFPGAPNQTISSGKAKAEKGDNYIEVTTINDLVDKYGLTLPKGFNLVEGSKAVTSDDDVKTVVLAQAPGATFDYSYVTYKFTVEGQPKSVDTTYRTTQETKVSNNTSDLLEEISAKDPNKYIDEIKKYYYKSGYIVDPATSKYTLDGNNYYEERTINFIKKPEVFIIDGPAFSSFNGYEFKAGTKYSLTKQVELYLEKGGNIQLPNSDYNIKVEKVTLKGKTIKPVNGSYVLNVDSKKNPQKYTVKFRVSSKDGAELRISGKEKTYKSYVVSNTAVVVDSAPVISGIKNASYKVGKFNALTGISAYDYVDKKKVKVTYTVYKYNTKTKKYVKTTSSALKKTGKYKLNYTAKDSVGHKVTKPRYVTIKK